MCRLWFSLLSFCFSYLKINLEFHYFLTQYWHHLTGYSARKRESEKLKRKGVVIFAMGTGSSVRDLEALASQPSYSHMFQLKSRSWIPARSDLKIALALCSGTRDKTPYFHWNTIHQNIAYGASVFSQTDFQYFNCRIVSNTPPFLFLIFFCLGKYACFAALPSWSDENFSTELIKSLVAGRN